jgi:hypothetical protein
LPVQPIIVDEALSLLENIPMVPIVVPVSEREIKNFQRTIQGSDAVKLDETKKTKKVEEEKDGPGQILRRMIGGTSSVACSVCGVQLKESKNGIGRHFQE